MSETTLKSNSLVLRLVLLAFGLCVSIFAVELAFRIALANTGKASKKPRTDRPVFYYAPAGSKTMLDLDHTQPKKPGAFRIAVLGDSFSFGPHIQYDDTFPKRLERILNARQEGPRAEVFNYGVSGFATIHQVKRSALAIKQQADLLILQITLNDPEPVPFSAAAAKDSIFAPYKADNFILRHWKSLSFIMERLHNYRARKAHEKYYFDIFNKQENWQGFSKSLQSIHELGKQAGVPVVAVVFPIFGYEFREKKYPFLELHAKIQAEMARLGIPALDLFDTFRGLNTDRLEVLPGSDSHPNEIAHARTAEQLYLWLVKNNFVPQNFKVDRRANKRLDSPLDIQE